jgi:hypothetical protein
MPFYRYREQILYYAHIPKCAGTSLNEYLEARFGKPAMQDRRYIKDPALSPWNKTSPQHIDRDALTRLFPRGFYDESFAVVRHPEARIASVFAFQKKERRIPRWMPISIWLASLERRRRRNPYIYDNHARPQVDFLPERTTIFRMEDGLDRVVNWLDERFTTEARDLRIGHAKRSDKIIVLDESSRSLVQRLYSADYEAFGYDA